MTPRRLNVPIPLDLIDDLEIAAEFADARPRPSLDTPEKRAAFEPLERAIDYVKANASGVRASRAAGRLPFTVTAFNERHLSHLQSYLNGLSGGDPAERDAIQRVVSRLEGLRADLGLPASGGLTIRTIPGGLELHAECRIARVPMAQWPADWSTSHPGEALVAAIVDWLRAHPEGAVVDADIETIKALMA